MTTYCGFDREISVPDTGEARQALADAIKVWDRAPNNNDPEQDAADWDDACIAMVEAGCVWLGS